MGDLTEAERAVIEAAAALDTDGLRALGVADWLGGDGVCGSTVDFGSSERKRLGAAALELQRERVKPEHLAALKAALHAERDATDARLKAAEGIPHPVFMEVYAEYKRERFPNA